MTSILIPIDKYIENIIDGKIDNPILKRVIYEDIIFSNNLKNIFKQYFSNIVSNNSNTDYLLNIATLLDNLDNDTKLIINKQITEAFIELNIDEQMSLILNLNESSKKIFKILSDDPTISQILKHLLSSMTTSYLHETYIIKFIKSCSIISTIISDEIVTDIIINHNLELINNDKLLAVILEYYSDRNVKLSRDCYQKINEILIIKFDTIHIKISTMKFDTMELAYEIYKLGTFICDTNLKYNSYDCFPKIKFTDEQIEYIVKSVHTSLINNNMMQAKKILSTLFIVDDKKSISTLIDNYSKWLLIRINMKIYSNENILDQEREIWNINNDYEYLMSLNIFNVYHKIINNVKYSIIINHDFQKQVFTPKLNNVTVKLITNSVSDKVIHHPKIQEYINTISTYIDSRTKLQHIDHDSKQSKITIKTEYGQIKCPLIIGSILLYLNDGNKTIVDIVNLLNIPHNEIEKRLKILMFFNIIVYLNSGEYKYVELYGSVECDDSLPEKSSNLNEHIVFSDVIMTIESRIIKTVKTKNVHKLELERNVQEFMGSSFCRNIYYNQLESLKKRFYIEENNNIIEYVP
jgi:hypothetical protein